MPRIAILLTMLFCLIAGVVDAKPINKDDIPEQLRDWVPWVLYGEEKSQCPFHYQRFLEKQCHWAGETSLSFTDNSGVFNQQWQISYAQWLPLPGRQDQWPQNVKVNGLMQTVVDRHGQPYIYLEAGAHNVTGAFEWLALPQTFKLPADVGLVSLIIDGEHQIFPRIDAKGELWLRENMQAQQKQQHDTVSINVHRQLVDAIPASVETRIELNVAGSERELLLKGALLDGFIAMQLVSALPARLESDGQLRVQVKAGQWVITLLERAPDNQLTFMLPASAPPWPAEEVWAFKAQPQLRQVTLSGATAIDPKNTRVPSSWHKWPAYQMQADTQLVIAQKQRGDNSQRLEQLELRRTWWLDFDGGGFSLQDTISGEVQGRYRLPMNANIALGRVAVNGEDQFITRLEGEDKQGVELRQGFLHLTADSRWMNTDNLPATGWDADFHKVYAQLNLPPGWRLFAATGVDNASGSWMARWTLLDLFLVFIIAASFSHLWGRKWGAVALVAMVVMYHEQGAPIAVWLNVLAASALLKVLPTGRFKIWIQRYFALSILAVVLIGLPFMVQQARQAIYPQLEHPNYSFQSQSSMVELDALAASPVFEEAMSVPSLANDSDGLGAVGASFEIQKPKRKLSSYDPNTKVQTGPGLPDWQWSSNNLSFNGPVDRGQTIGLWLVSPTENRLLAIARIALLVLLVVCVSGWRRGINFKAVLPALFMVMVVSGGLIPTPVMAKTVSDLPDKTLLEQLKQRLLVAPDCLPQCASSPSMQLTVSNEQLVIHQRIDAAESIIVPLPGQRGHWSPQQVLVDGGSTINLHHDKKGHLWLNLLPGSHDIVVRGELPAQALVQLILPMKPHTISVNQAGNWLVQGNTKPGEITDLVLKRRQSDTEQPGEEKVLTPTSLPAFLKVERRLHFGQQWQLETIVTRLTPADSLVQLEIPLLEGEVVTKSGVTVKNGNMPIHLPQGQTRYQWLSLLDESTLLNLQAPVTTEWVEHWSLSWGPIWHVEWQGTPVINAGQSAQVDWRPWPGEQLSLTVQRPAGEAGQTLTMDQSNIEIHPGQRSSEVSLQLVLRSSLGQQHSITLPEDAQLSSVSSDGHKLALELIDGQLNLPIHPGVQKINIEWRQTVAAQFWFDTPQIEVGLAGVNHEINLSIPRDRWILAVGGPSLGPAVLMWGVLLVLVLFAIGLGRLSLTPLKTHHWALLLLGLTQASMITLVIVIGWLLVLGWRFNRPITESRWGFNLLQVGLVILTLIALSSLFFAIQQGLLGQPDMQIVGNGSYQNYLHWYQDRTVELLPQAWVVSLPLFVYRAIMLLWALWLAFALLKWLSWGWQCFSRDGIWRHIGLKLPAKPWADFGIKTDKNKDKTKTK